MKILSQVNQYLIESNSKDFRSRYWLIKDTSRRMILHRFTPKFTTVVAHHITYRGLLDELNVKPKKVEIVGYASDDYIEALVCRVDGLIKRPDGSLFHITLSYDPAKRKPVDSNKIVQDYKRIIPHMIIQVKPAQKL